MGILLKRQSKVAQAHKNDRRGRRLPKRVKKDTPKRKRKARTTYRKYRI
jgi:hypothetical protein